MTKQSTKIIIKAEFRTVFGDKTKRLRRDGFIPANVYGQGKKSASLSLPTNQFQSLFVKHGGDLGLVYIQVDDKTQPALVTEISRHPVTGGLIHVEFMRVNLKEEVETEVALEVVGEVDVPNTVLEVIRDEIKIKALPEDIPEHIVVDVSSLTEAGQMIAIADLKFNKDKITLLIDEEEMEKPVVLLQEVKEEVEPEVVETEVEDGVEKSDDGEAEPETKSEEKTDKPESTEDSQA